jgi:hypothetical protein
VTQDLQKISRLNYPGIKYWLFCWFPFALLAGNVEISFGASSLTLPLTVPLLVTIIFIDFVLLRFRTSKRLLLFIILYLAFLILGLIAGIGDQSTSIERNLASLLPYICGLLVLLAFKDVDLPCMIPKVMVLSGAILSIIVIFRSIWVLVPVFSGGWEAAVNYKAALVLPLGPSNFLAVYLMFFSIFAWSENKAVWIIILAGVALTLSRFGIAFTLLAALFSSARKLPISFYCAGLFVANCVFLLFVFFGGEIFQYLISDGILPPSIVARLDLWFAGVNLITLNPLFPSGPGGFTSYLELISWPRAEWGVHNWVLSIWIEFGFFGLLLYVCIMGLLLILPSSMDSPDHRRVKLAVILLFLYAGVENVVEVSSFQLLFAFMIVLLFSKKKFGCHGNVLVQSSSGKVLNE